MYQAGPLRASWCFIWTKLTIQVAGTLDGVMSGDTAMIAMSTGAILEGHSGHWMVPTEDVS